MYPENVILCEVSQKEKKQISCNITYMCSLKKMIQINYLQSRNKNTDGENKCTDTKRGKGSGMNWETGIDTYALVGIK